MTDLNPTSSLAVPAGVSNSLRSAPAQAKGNSPRLSTEAWVQIAILTPLFFAVYWIVLRWLWDKTNPFYGEANWGHAICIPFVGLYYLFINRDDLLAEPVQPLLLGNFMAKHRLIPGACMLVLGGGIWLLSLANRESLANIDPDGLVRFAGMLLGLYGLLVLALDWGIGSFFFGLALFAYGIYPGKNQFLQGCAMIVTLFGTVLMLTGWRVMKWAWFPIAYLICGIPWPALVYSYIASPLQTFAAKVAVKALQFTGVTAYRTGTKINMGGITEPLRTLNVAEACAGMRSLMTFITVAVAVAFLSARPLWQKLIITVSAIPIAIFCNVMRVAGQGLLDHYVSRQLSESFAHQFVGLVMLVPAFFLILLVGWMLDHIFMEEVEETPESKAAARAAMSAAAANVIEIPRRGNVTALAARRPAAAAMRPVPPAGGVARTQAAPSARPQTAPPQAGSPARPQRIPPQAPPHPQTMPPRPGTPPQSARPQTMPPRPGVPPQQRPPQAPRQQPPQPPRNPQEGQ